jgi:hypothetical protein
MVQEYFANIHPQWFMPHASENTTRANKVIEHIDLSTALWPKISNNNFIRK